jgi:hypothetical protein
MGSRLMGSRLMGSRLMGSRLMGSVGLYNQIEPDLLVPNYTVNPNVCTKLIRLLVSFD